MSRSIDSQDILNEIRHLVEALRGAARETERSFGISGAQLYVMEKLSYETGLSMNELAARTFTHQSSASVVVTRLEEKLLVERRRSKVDGRRLEIYLTEKGKRLLGRAPTPIQNRLLDAIDGISVPERGCLAKGLKALNSKAGIGGKSPPFLFEERKK